MKAFNNTATAVQVRSARELIGADLLAGVFVSSDDDWRAVFAEATRLAEQYTPSIGCRSLDIPHCAAAKVLAVLEFITADVRQRKLTMALGLNAVVL